MKRTYILLVVLLAIASCDFNSGKYDLQLILQVEPPAKTNKNTYKSIRTLLQNRLDSYGITPNRVDVQISNNNITLKIHGVDDPQRIKRLLTTQGKLEFWETYDNVKLYPILARANKLLKEKLYLPLPKEEKEKSPLLRKLMGIRDTASVDYTPPEDESADDTLLPVAKPVERHEDEFEKYAAENPLFAVLRPVIEMGFQTEDYYPVKGASIGYAHHKDTLVINNYLARKDVLALFPADIKFLWAWQPYDENKECFQLYVIRMGAINSEAPITGDAITEAWVDEYQGVMQIAIQMNEEATMDWQRMTRNNIGQSIAIVIDDKVNSAPVVQSEIVGGRSSITGNFTNEEAEDFIHVLTSGALRFKLQILDETITDRNE